MSSHARRSGTLRKHFINFRFAVLSYYSISRAIIQLGQPNIQLSQPIIRLGQPIIRLGQSIIRLSQSIIRLGQPIIRLAVLIRSSVVIEVLFRGII